MPPMPEGVEEGILKGSTGSRPRTEQRTHRAQLLGSGSIMQQVLARPGAARRVSRRRRRRVERDVVPAAAQSRLSRPSGGTGCIPEEPGKQPYVTEVLEPHEGPVVAVSDSIKAVPDQIARWVPAPYVSSGHRRLRAIGRPRAAAPALRDRRGAHRRRDAGRSRRVRRREARSRDRGDRALRDRSGARLASALFDV